MSVEAPVGFVPVTFNFEAGKITVSLVDAEELSAVFPDEPLPTTNNDIKIGRPYDLGRYLQPQAANLEESSKAEDRRRGRVGYLKSEIDRAYETPAS